VAVSTPAVQIFSARDGPGKRGPCGSQDDVLQKHVPSVACYLGECPRDNLCGKLV
jgi:hypothetical protein